VRTGQEDERASQLGRLARSSERGVEPELGHAVAALGGWLQRRPDRAGSHGIHPDSAGPDLCGEIDGEVVDGRLGRRVVDEWGRGIVGLNRRKIDDAGVLAHVCERLLSHPEHRVEVRLEDAIHLVSRDVGDPVFPPGPLKAGIVDENVESSQQVGSGVHHAARGCFIGDVAGQQKAACSRFLDPVLGVFGVALFLRKIAQRHVAALPSEGDGHCPTDSRIAAGDQGLHAG